jgi:hypothetical protein
MYRLNSLNGRLIWQIIGCCEDSAEFPMIGRRKELEERFAMDFELENN